MAAKVFVNYEGGLATGQAEKICQKVADALGICPEDVVLLPGHTLAVVEVPEELTTRRVKADKEAEKQAEKDAKAQEEADKAAKAREDAKAKEEAKVKAEAAKAEEDARAKPEPKVEPAKAAHHGTHHGKG